MTMDDPYIRRVQTSVTCFLHCGDEYLFLLRSVDKKIDPNKLNGVGGRVEPGENYLAAAIRETAEETGYGVGPADTELAGIVRLEGGYDEDWVMAFFRIAVPTKTVPVGFSTPDGTLMWIHRDRVTESGHELVDDLHYCFADIAAAKTVFFATAAVGADKKITAYSASSLPVPFPSGR
jgi:8-oxo-dGTP pyrophosphatase MutT (NUDIX family)